jgi:hypothetical protein
MTKDESAHPLTRREQMRQRCEEFHRRHPEVWEMFKGFTQDRIALGFESYSADAIFHRIRWETARPEYKRGEEFKLNDHYTAFYARRFHKAYPHLAGFFRTRKQTSEGADACNLPELGPGDYRPEGTSG